MGTQTWGPRRQGPDLGTQASGRQIAGVARSRLNDHLLPRRKPGRGAQRDQRNRQNSLCFGGGHVTYRRERVQVVEITQRRKVDQLARVLVNQQRPLAHQEKRRIAVDDELPSAVDNLPVLRPRGLPGPDFRCTNARLQAPLLAESVPFQGPPSQGLSAQTAARA